MYANSTKINCLVICTSLPTFLFSGSMMYSAFPVMILCTHDLVDIIRSISSKTTFVGVIQDYIDGMIDHPVGNVKLALIQGNLNNTILKLLTGLNIRLFLGDRLPRRLHSSWRLERVIIEHKRFGGVTTSVKSLFVGWCKDDEVHLLNPKHMEESRDASTIHDDSIWCYKFKRRPKEMEIKPLRCVNLGSAAVPIYHIGGLLPIQNLFRCSIVCPARGNN